MRDQGMPLYRELGSCQPHLEGGAQVVRICVFISGYHSWPRRLAVNGLDTGPQRTLSSKLVPGSRYHPGLLA